MKKRTKTSLRDVGTQVKMTFIVNYFMKICNYTEDQKEAKDVSVIINSRKHLCVRDFSNVALYTVRKFN